MGRTFFGSSAFHCSDSIFNRIRQLAPTAQKRATNTLERVPSSQVLWSLMFSFKMILGSSFISSTNNKLNLVSILFCSPSQTAIFVCRLLHFVREFIIFKLILASVFCDYVVFMEMKYVRTNRYKFAIIIVLLRTANVFSLKSVSFTVVLVLSFVTFVDVIVNAGL